MDTSTGILSTKIWAKIPSQIIVRNINLICYWPQLSSTDSLKEQPLDILQRFTLGWQSSGSQINSEEPPREYPSPKYFGTLLPTLPVCTNSFWNVWKFAIQFILHLRIQQNFILTNAGLKVDEKNHVKATTTHYLQKIFNETNVMLHLMCQVVLKIVWPNARCYNWY